MPTLVTLSTVSMMSQLMVNSVLSDVDPACPECRASLQVSDDTIVCGTCDLCYRRDGRIWNFLSPSRAAHYRPFLERYRQVREAEGWAGNEASYYRRLPEVLPEDPQSTIWRMRQRSFETVVSRVVEPMESSVNRPLTIIDAGAGNGWLSNRLARRGHRLVAVDVQSDRRHGLGACAHYRSAFLPVLAEYDRLPLAEDTADMVVFNASLHYANDICRPIAEALRILRDDGRLVVLDSPVYECPESGEQMVRERDQIHEDRHGVDPDAANGTGYIVRGQLDRLAEEFGLEWTEIDPKFGLRRRFHRWATRLLRGREAARMPVLVGKRVAEQEVAPPSAHQRHSWIHQRLGYLWRLIRATVSRNRQYDTLAIEEIGGWSLIVLPGVFNPALFRSSQWLVELMEEGRIPAGQRVLDMGTGAGLTALAAASRGADVTAVDINPAAVRCVRMNALFNKVEQQIDVRQGDLFAPVEGERFDTVFFNPPFYEGVPDDAIDYAWRGTDIADRFARGLKEYLRRSGTAYVVLSSKGVPERFLEALRAQDFVVRIVQTYDLISETQAVYGVSHPEEPPC